MVYYCVQGINAKYTNSDGNQMLFAMWPRAASRYGRRQDTCGLHWLMKLLRKTKNILSGNRPVVLLVWSRRYLRTKHLTRTAAPVRPTAPQQAKCGKQKDKKPTTSLLTIPFIMSGAAAIYCWRLLLTLTGNRSPARRSGLEGFELLVVEICAREFN